MYPVIKSCPICKENLIVAKLHCPTCESNIEGQFSLGPFDGLSSEQLQFAEIFIRCEGKLNRVEKELDISYPTVRSRLHELIRAMGYDVEEEINVEPVDRQAILAEVAAGNISAEEAAQRLTRK